MEERSTELHELHEALFPADEPKISHPSVSSGPAPAPSPLADAEVIEKASSAANGEKFKRLWAGDWQGDYHSHSEAGETLCCKLAFWTGKDADHMDALFRGSGLFRDKWVQRDDYRRETIARAINRTSETYTGSQRDRVEKLYASLAAQRSRQVEGIQTATPAAPDVSLAPAPAETLTEQSATLEWDFEELPLWPDGLGKF
jgi:primase-polymerase (primpol)-like protein